MRLQRNRGLEDVIPAVDLQGGRNRRQIHPPVQVRARTEMDSRGRRPRCGGAEAVLTQGYHQVDEGDP
jgi:hypothetical protein